MPVQLTPNEARVIGCLLEKERTTPEQYPLSLNSLTNACNQKSSRDPVMELGESTVQDTLDALVKAGLVMNKSGFGSRVVKYRHRFCNSEFGTLKLSDQELGIVCVLLLRGPQTPGELRTRTERLCGFSDVHEVEATLEHLLQRADGPFVARLPREPGKREVRYAHLFGGEVPGAESVAPPVTAATESGAAQDRIEQLEAGLAALRREVEQLKERLDRIAPA
jgi:uncharacterized protein